MTAELEELWLCRQPESGPACPYRLLGKQGIVALPGTEIIKQQCLSETEAGTNLSHCR